jgi:HEAT repeat protein
VEPLVAALKDSNGDVRQCVVEALGKIGDARAVEPLIAALTDSDGFIRVDAVKALGKIGDVRAVEPLIAALEGGHGRLRRIAAEVLVDWYQRGRLDNHQRRLLQVQRERIVAPHNDSGAGCGSHADSGIGIDFPL